MASFCFSYPTGPDQQTPEQPARPAASLVSAHYERTEINKNIHIYVDVDVNVDVEVDATNFDSPQSSQWSEAHSISLAT